MVKQDKKEKKDLIKQKQAELEAKYLRALADYQNLIKQTAREKIEFAKYANQGLLQEIIPVYDHLKMSLQHANHEENEWITGVRHIVKQFQEVLSTAGVSEIETLGHEFNPLLMLALQQEETENEQEEGLVAKEIRPGYMLYEKVIIPAQVAVYKYKNN
ncbi:MAG: nucleotide exchange factor GrpE [bacterium]